MNGIITTENLDNEECINLIRNEPKMNGLNLVPDVSTKKKYLWNEISLTNFDQRKKTKPTKSNNLNVVAIDFGIKSSILHRLASHGCEITVVPHNSNLDEVLSSKPDGIFFSNGPGDPSTVLEGIKLAQQLF